MVKDVLILANDYYNFTSAIHNPEEYLKLDDGILNTIENFQYEQNVSAKLLQASQIVNRLRKREIYNFVGEILIPKNCEEMIPKIKIAEIISFDNPKDEYYVGPEDLDIISSSIDYGNGERNPMEHIQYYKNESPDVSFNSSTKLSLAVPNVFKESYVFVYCKNKNKLERAKNIFQKFLSKLNKDMNELREQKKNFTTPIKSRNKDEEFISLKRERDTSGSQESKINMSLNFNKIS